MQINGKKKIKLINFLITLVLIVGFLSGCSLIDMLIQGSGDVYFYSMGMEGSSNTPVNYSLDYRKEGYTIIMSFGNNEMTEAEALILKGTTSFSVTLESDEITPDSASIIKKLDKGWHVVQPFTLPLLEKGTYTLIGTTVGVRVDTVTLTIE